MSAARDTFIAGLKRVAPVLLGTLPFGMMTGVATMGAGLPVDAAVIMSCIVFAGTAQLAAMQLLSAGTPLPVILLTVCIINLRFLMYSAAIAPHFKQHSLRWKLLIGYLLSDNGFAVSITRYNREPNMRHKRWFYLGACCGIWVVWLLGCLLGIFLGAQIPPKWSLDFVIPLIFVGLLVPVITDRATAAAALTAGTIAVAAHALPYQLGLIAAALAGIAAGMLVESAA